MPTVVVVRLWSPADPDTADAETLCGVVEVIGAGCSFAFDGEEELIAVIRRANAGGHVMRDRKAR